MLSNQYPLYEHIMSCPHRKPSFSLDGILPSYSRVSRKRFDMIAIEQRDVANLH
jgi:hypothetical protein